MISRYDNVSTQLHDDTLTITINLDESQVDAQPSKSGKTVVLATTGGAINVVGYKLNLTLYRKL